MEAQKGSNSMKINELENLLGVTRATIRYYEDQGLVTPARTENGYRDYSDEEALLFQKIIVLRKLGAGVPEIRDLIEGKTTLHDVLTGNVERLRAQQGDTAAAIRM
jgi:DNA-binding transcriptional MerR regulator